LKTLFPQKMVSSTGNALLSDESSLMLFPMSGRVYVWRIPMQACCSHYYPSWPNSLVKSHDPDIISEWQCGLPKKTMPPFTQMELFSHGLKSMKVNFNIFPGQHNYQVWTPLNHSGHFWGQEWGLDSHLQYLQSDLKMFFKKNGMKFH
jgi:hypothetical protein